MSTRYEIAVVGASIDGLIAAAYLAKAGRSVVVLESSKVVGGDHKTVEFASGFKIPAAFDSIEALHPSIIEDLNLSANGLKMIEGGGRLLLDKDGFSLHMNGSGEISSREPISDSDKEELGVLRALLLDISRALKPAMTQPLADPTIDRFAGLADLMHLGWALRRLGKKTMPEALRYLPTNIRDVVDERFESKALKTLIASEALRGTRMAPRYDGSAFSLLHKNPFWTGGLGHSLRFAEGGPGAFAEALASSAILAGVNVQLETAVTSVRVGNEGSHQVVLSDGTVIEAGTVVSTADPKSTLLDLVGARHLQPDHVEKATQIRGRGALSILRLALSELPTVPGAPEGTTEARSMLSGRIVLGAEVDDLERAFDAVKYGEIPETPFLSATIPSISDPSLAPEGQHVMNVWIHFTPYDLRGRSWEDSSAALRDRVIQMLDESMPGFASSVLHDQILTPKDIEREFGAPEGCLDHVEISLDQILYMRPMPGWFRYRTPVDGLYIAGPGTHPGGQSGLSGKCAAQQVLQDLKR